MNEKSAAHIEFETMMQRDGSVQPTQHEITESLRHKARLDAATAREARRLARWINTPPTGQDAAELRALRQSHEPGGRSLRMRLD